MEIIEHKARAGRGIREIRCPYDGSIAGTVDFAGPEVLSGVVDRAMEGFARMREMPPYGRAQVLEKMARSVEEHHGEIARTIALEAAKPIKLAGIEASRCALTFRTAAAEALRMGGECMSLEFDESAAKRSGFTRRFPIGPILGISPFNFPLNLAAHKVAPAIAAGNSIILKPSSSDPLSALWLARLASEAGLPGGVLQVVPCSPADLEPVLQDERVKMITFTGSAPVGWGIKARSGKKRVALELGGNAGVIVDRGCNVDYAVSRILMGGFAYAGQVCISVQRVLIHEDIYGQVENALVEGASRLKVGDPLDPEAMLSAMITEKEAVRVESWIGEAVKAGGRLLTGGRREGSRVSPAVLSGVPRDAKLWQEEAFGPVIVLERFKGFDEAVGMVNDSRFGLQAGVFTPSLESAMEAFERIECGGVMINDVPTFRIDPMPYGGVKESGMGREGVKYAMEEMTELRLMVINRS
jgi:glyceraldehyde-3-phosphate dehydrogenase (NADP+)